MHMHRWMDRHGTPPATAISRYTASLEELVGLTRSLSSPRTGLTCKMHRLIKTGLIKSGQKAPDVCFVSLIVTASALSVNKAAGRGFGTLLRQKRRLPIFEDGLPLQIVASNTTIHNSWKVYLTNF